MGLKIVKVSEGKAREKIKDVLLYVASRDGKNRVSVEYLAEMLLGVVLEGKSVENAWLEAGYKCREGDGFILNRDRRGKDFVFEVIVSEPAKGKKTFLIEKRTKKEMREEVDDIWNW